MAGIVNLGADQEITGTIARELMEASMRLGMVQLQVILMVSIIFL
ncbi:MAG: hypothetical protein RCG15_02870 [Candidatus Rickettsia vulgarisii]